MVIAHKLADGRYECQNCLKKFSKNPRATIEPKFCKDECRKEFHKAGGMSYRKLKDMVRRIVSEMLAERGITAL